MTHAPAPAPVLIPPTPVEQLTTEQRQRREECLQRAATALRDACIAHQIRTERKSA